MQTKIANLDRFLRLPEVVERTTRSAASIWRDEKAGRFPPRRQLGPGAVGWLESEVSAWMQERAARPAGPSVAPEQQPSRRQMPRSPGRPKESGYSQPHSQQQGA